MRSYGAQQALRARRAMLSLADFMTAYAEPHRSLAICPACQRRLPPRFVVLLLTRAGCYQLLRRVTRWVGR